MNQAVPPQLQLTLSARALVHFVALCSGLVLTLGCLHLVLRIWPNPFGALLTTRLDLGAELSLPAWYSSILLMSVAVLMLVCSHLEKMLHTPTSKGWLILGLGFAYMSFDELSVIHELFGKLTGDFPDLFGFLSYRWVIIGIPIVIVVAIGFLPFLLRLPSPTRIRLIVAGAIYVGGAIGLELIGARLGTTMGFDHPSAVIAANVEEILEIVGVTLAFRALVLHLAGLPGAPALRFQH